MSDTDKKEACAQCGTCCKKNSPALHQDDLHLLEKGIIPLRDLYTIRAGEPARDNVRGIMTEVTSDIIKIKGKDKAWTCIYFKEDRSACGIYRHRPAECRALKCWDTGEIERLYEKDRLDRKTVLRDKPEFRALAEDHQQRCDYKRLKRLVDALDRADRGATLKSLSEIIHYDRNLRLLLVEKTRIDPGVCDFLFGRPLTMTLRAYGVELQENGGKLTIPQIK